MLLCTLIDLYFKCIVCLSCVLNFSFLSKLKMMFNQSINAISELLLQQLATCVARVLLIRWFRVLRGPIGPLDSDFRGNP